MKEVQRQKIINYSPFKVTHYKTGTRDNHEKSKELLVKNINQHHKRDALMLDTSNDKSGGYRFTYPYKVGLDIRHQNDVNFNITKGFTNTKYPIKKLSGQSNLGEYAAKQLIDLFKDSKTIQKVTFNQNDLHSVNIIPTLKRSSGTLTSLTTVANVNNITQLSKSIARMNKLRYLKLSGYTYITNANLKQILKSFSHFLSFELPNHSLNKQEVQLMAEKLKKNDILEKLELHSSTYLDKEPIDITDLIRELINSTKIKHLTLQGFTVNSGIKSVADLLEVKKSLLTLDIGELTAPIDENDLTALAQSLAANKTLKSLKLSGLTSSDAAVVFRGLASNSSLRELTIRLRVIEEDMPEALKELLKKHKNLTSISIAFNARSPSYNLTGIREALEDNFAITNLNIQGMCKGDFDEIKEILERNKEAASHSAKWLS